MTRLPPIEEETFDGEKHKVEIIDKRCQHVLELVGSIEAKCSKCGAGWTGNNIRELVRLINKQ